MMTPGSGRSGLTARGALWALIGVSTLLRLAWALSLGAAFDEPYYLEYIWHPAWCYFDHPPMVAVVGAAGLALWRDAFSVVALRVGFIALFAGSTWLMARLTARYYGPRAGFLAALALNATGYFGLSVGTIAQPDGPMLFFWLLTLDRLAVALDRPDRISPWLGVGAAWGGAMLSKYYAVLLPAGAVLFLVLRPRLLRCLRTPGPYLAVVVGFVLFAPVVGWNATHGWVSFLYQGGRASAPRVFQPGALAAALGTEAAYVFPWLWVPLVGALVGLARRGPRRWDDGEAFLVSQAVPALVLFHGVACFGRIQAHWPLIGFVSLVPLLGRDWARGLDLRPVLHRRWIAAVAVAPVCLAALVTAQEWFGLLPAPARNDPTVELISWDQVADELQRRGVFSEPRTFLFTDSWERSARLALATRGKAAVACYNLEPRSFTLWSRPEDWLGRDGIFVEADRRPGELANYARFFRRYEPIGTAKVVRRGSVVREVHLYRGTCQTWPFPFDGRFNKLKSHATPPQIAAGAAGPATRQ